VSHGCSLCVSLGILVRALACRFDASHDACGVTLSYAKVRAGCLRFAEITRDDSPPRCGGSTVFGIPLGCCRSCVPFHLRAVAQFDRTCVEIRRSADDSALRRKTSSARLARTR